MKGRANLQLWAARVPHLLRSCPQGPCGQGLRRDRSLRDCTVPCEGKRLAFPLAQGTHSPGAVGSGLEPLTPTVDWRAVALPQGHGDLRTHRPSRTPSAPSAHFPNFSRRQRGLLFTGRSLPLSASALCLAPRPKRRSPSRPFPRKISWRRTGREDFTQPELETASSLVKVSPIHSVSHPPPTVGPQLGQTHYVTAAPHNRAGLQPQGKPGSAETWYLLRTDVCARA